MANQSQLFSLAPLTKDDLAHNVFSLEIPADVLELQADSLNVEEGRVDLSSFDEERQQKIKDYYRFTARMHNSKSHHIAQRSKDTLDLL